MTRTEQYASEALARSVELQRVATALVRDALAVLQDLRAEMIRALVSVGPAGVGLVSGLVAGRFARIQRELRDRFTEIAESQRSFEAEMIGGRPSIEMITMDVLGAGFLDWLGRMQEDVTFRLRAEARSIFGVGEPSSIPKHFGQDVIQWAGKALDALVRTGLSGMATEARLAAVRANPGDYRFQQLSVLDNRTTRVCVNYANKVWDRDFQPVGHSLPFEGGPPRHWGCRSTVVVLFPRESLEMGFGEWLKGLGVTRGNRLFGEKNLRLWREEKITLSDLVRQERRPLVPGQL